MWIREAALIGVLATGGVAGCSSDSDQAAPPQASTSSSPSASASASPSASTTASSPSRAAPPQPGSTATPQRSSSTPAAPAPTPTPSATSTPGTTPSTPPATQEPTPQPGYPSVAEAIEAAVLSGGVEFAGLCEEAELADIGKYCYVIVEDRGTEVVAVIGQVYSEFEAYLLVRLEDSGWRVVDNADYPYSDDGSLPF